MTGLVSRTGSSEERFRQQDKLIGAQMKAIAAQIAALRDVMEKRFDAMDKSFTSRFASLRADLTQVALAMGAQPRSQAG